MPKKLKKQIEKKLDKLNELLDQMEEAHIIQADEPETWDSDTLYNLVEKLKETLQLLEDKKINRRNEFGENIFLVETGLCSLVDNYQSEQEEEDD